MRIIVGYDGSECARAALSELRRAGLPRQAEAQVISVAELWFPPPPPSSYETLGAPIGGQDAKESGSSVVASPSEGAVPEALAETRLLGAEASRKLLEYFPEWTVSSHACTGSPAWEIVSRAEL